MQQQQQPTEIETKAISLASLVSGGPQGLVAVGAHLTSLGQAGWAVIDQGLRDRDLLILARLTPQPDLAVEQPATPAPSDTFSLPNDPTITPLSSNRKEPVERTDALEV